MTLDDHRDLEELEHEFRRVGITWDAFGELCRLNDPHGPVSPDGSFAMELDYQATTAFLRTLPDGAGQAVFIAAWLKRRDLDSMRKRAEAATRAENRKRGRGRSDSGAAGA